MRLQETPLSTMEYDLGGSCVVLSLVGQADIGDRVWFHRLLRLAEVQGQHRVIVDLSRLSSMDWWVALMLLWVSRVFSRRGGVLVLACPQPVVGRLLEATGEADELPIYDSVRQASSKVAIMKPNSPMIEGAAIGASR